MLLLVLVVGLPLFVSMPLWFDVLHYDICASRLLKGEVLYRDAFDNNLPGIMWMQAAVRAVVGWRTEALRFADFCFVSIATGLLLRWVPAGGTGAPARAGTAAAVAAFYLFSPEDVHAQRDVWMFLPAVGAFVLRDMQVRAIGAGAGGAPIFARGFLEGLGWGAAFWVKPFVAVPALATWVTGFWAVQPRWRAWLVDVAGVIGGGLAAGALGLGWLATTGAWRSFWDCLLGWNRDYATVTFDGLPRGTWLFLQVVFYLPWSVIQVIALLTAVTALARAPAAPASSSRALLGAFYLGWLVQATLIQRPHDYVLAPTIILAVVLVAGSLQTEIRPALRVAALVPFVLLVLIATPGLRPGRLMVWARCCREAASPELMDRLKLEAKWHGGADWQDLARVADFLRAQGAADGEVTCLGGCSHALYLMLDLEPSTRFHQPGTAVIFCPSRADEVRAELQASRSKYLISDLADLGRLTYDQAQEIVPGDPLALPPSFPPDLLQKYPWTEPLIFRAGRYVVHRAQGAVPRFW